MAAVAIAIWFCTALVGLYLLAVWLIENDVRGGAPASRLPGPVLLGHAGLALTGLAIWGSYLYTDSDPLGWAAGIILVPVALFGLFMFTRWIPVHRSFDPPAGPGGSRHAVADTPAERHFRVSVVVGHGLLAAATITMVWFTLLAGS